MIAVLGGTGAAIAWGLATVCASRSSRMIGAGATLGWVMIVGLAVALPVLALSDRPALSASELGWLALAGIGNVVGLWLEYVALRRGKVGVVAPIASTEGAIAALIAVALGESLAPGVGVALAVIVCGVVLTGIARDEGDGGARSHAARPIVFAVGAALLFGASLYAAGRIGSELPVAWVLLPARVVGVAFIALPLALRSRLHLPRRSVPFVVTAGVCEVAGFASFALGARHGIAVSSVLASQFAVLAALLAFALFRERLAWLQVAGACATVAGVAALIILQT